MLIIVVEEVVLPDVDPEVLDEPLGMKPEEMEPSPPMIVVEVVVEPVEEPDWLPERPPTLTVRDPEGFVVI